MNVRKFEYRITLIVGILVLIVSAYFFFYGSYEDIALAFLLLGIAFAFETAAAVLGNKKTSEGNAGDQSPRD